MTDDETRTRPAPRARQSSIFFRRDSYSAFPHLVRLEGDELLVAFRQAPQEEGVHHTHPRSIITVMRSCDGGRSWDSDGATQLAAGGGQEFGVIYLGDGTVAGALAWHEVVPVHEAQRAGIPRHFPNEYPFRTPGSLWAWSGNYGLSWLPTNVLFFGPNTMPCAPPVRLDDGTILCPAYSWTGEIGAMSSVVYASPDGGETWSGPVTTAEGNAQAGGFCEPCVVEHRPGHLRAMHRVEGGQGPGGCFWTNESPDGGRTWSEPMRTGILSGACPRLARLQDGRLLLTFGRRYEPYDIRAMLSADGGNTWGRTAWILRSGRNANLGYTSSVELEEGEILTVTYMENARGTTGIVGTFWRAPQ